MDPLKKILSVSAILLVTHCLLVTSQGHASKRCEILGQTKAICTEKHLISAKLDGLPLDLRSLVLDRNQISVLEDNVLWVSSPLYLDQWKVRLVMMIFHDITQ